MSSDKFLSFLGLCRRAGKLTIGNDLVAQTMANGESCLVLIANDISQRTEKDITQSAQQNNVSIIRLSYTKEQLSNALGKLTAVISINDSGFAKKILQLTDNL